MPNMTMSIDEHLLIKARRVALEKRTSVNALVRGYLEKLTTEEDKNIEQKIRAFRGSIKKHSVTLGPVTWKREDLYER